MKSIKQASASRPNAFSIPARSVAHDHRYRPPVERTPAQRITVIGAEKSRADNDKRFGMRWTSI